MKLSNTKIYMPQSYWKTGDVVELLGSGGSRGKVIIAGKPDAEGYVSTYQYKKHIKIILKIKTILNMK